MKNNKTPFGNQEKRLYYQYLGFVNSLNLFTDNVIDIEYFNFEKQSISYEEFQSFSLDVKVPLGKRVERFFEFYIEQHDNYKMLKKNIQVNHEKITVGEFDFFIEELSTKKIIHVELVYKFYIYKEHKEEIERYHGPNNHDNLEDKLHKLKTKQFPLLFNPLAQDLLGDLSHKKVTQQLCFLGNIFIHKKDEAQFEAINESTIAGSYLTFEEFLNDGTYQDKLYFIPQKEDWLIEAQYCEFWYKHLKTTQKIKKYFDKSISQLVWVKEGNHYSRMFILK